MASRTLSHAVAEDLSAYIDAEIQGYEREVMLDILAKLPPELRQNVVYADPLCQFFVNRVALRNVTEFLQPVIDNVYVTRLGEEIVMPVDNEGYDYYHDGPPGGEAGMTQSEMLLDPNAVTVCDTPNDPTGPFRRIVSKIGTSSRPYNVVRSLVWLPSSTSGDLKMNRSLDVPHVYFGGNASGSKDLEAGVFWNPAKDNWAMYHRGGGSCEKPLLTKRFKSGQRIELVVHVVENNRLGLGVYGTFTDGGQGWVECVFDSTGWRRNGVDNRFRRMTSIAQKRGKYDPKSGSYVRGVEWSSV
ncbi:MAG: hypothetical protein ACRDFT_07505, partial [bacterium]